MLDPVFRSKIRISVIAFCFFLCFGIILIALWRMQILQNENTLVRMKKQYVRNVSIPAVRGRILTSDGEVLAGNRPVSNIIFHTLEMRQPGSRIRTIEYLARCAARIGRVIGRDNAPSAKEISAYISRHRGEPLPIFLDLNPRELASAAEFSSAVPGMEIVCVPGRTYPHGSLAGNLIGYIRSEDPLNAAGLEWLYDTWSEELLPLSDATPGMKQKHPLLRGVPGRKMVYVDPRGFVRDDAGTVLPAENGKDIILTLDFRMQRIAERLMRGLTGAMIVMDAENGEVLVMVSSPSYSPADFIPRISAEDFRRLSSDPKHPLINRAVRGEYSPGSIIKPLVAAGLLESGFGQDETIFCDGATRFGETALHCWIYSSTGGGHGTMTMKEAITVSCNDFFVESGLRLGMEQLREIYASAGIGTKTGFPLLEGTGRLPDRKHRKNWNSFDTALISIGQGDVLVTPLQAAVYISAIANGGTRFVPRIMRKIVDAEGNTVFSTTPAEAGRLQASPETLAAVRDAMRNAVAAPNGSARRAANDYVELSGKTGTAEVGAKVSKNVWFAGFGRLPDSGRLCTIIVFVEHGSSGGKTAAPAAAGFFTELGRIMPKKDNENE